MKVRATKTWKELTTGFQQLVRVLFNKISSTPDLSLKNNDLNTLKAVLSYWGNEKSSVGMNNLFRAIPSFKTRKQVNARVIIAGKENEGNFARRFQSFL